MSEAKANPQMAVAGISFYDELPKEGVFRIGLLVKDRAVPKRAVTAVASPLSFCKIVSVVILTEPSSNKNEDDLLQECHVKPGTATLLLGEEGFKQMLKSDVDAVYVIVPTEQQSHYSIAALKAGKHVLLDDPISTALDEFREQISYARKVKRFLQFPTMFVHHHRVASFLRCVLYEKFGSIESIDVRLTVNYDDLHNVGVSLPLSPGQGCIKRLGRYCALITALMLTRAGSRPLSAKVEKVTRSENNGEPLSADCIVRFTGDCVLKFHVGYSLAPTRQILEVRSRDRYATMTDFVIPHPDGLATYRLYEKAHDPFSGKLEVVTGEAMDVQGGPSQEIMMWLHFRELCRSVEEEGWSDSPWTLHAREITSVSLQTKSILVALTQSLEQNGTEIAIDVKDCDIH